VERLLYRNKGNTLGFKKAAVKSVFDRAGLPDPTGGTMVKLLLRGMRREDGPSTSTKQPASLRHLEGLHSDLQARRLGRKGTAMWAAACLGYFFALRSRSYSAKGKNGKGRDNGSYDERDILRRRDVRFLAGEGVGAVVVKPTMDNAHTITRMVVVIKRSKSDPAGLGYERAINANSHPYICPVKAVLAHLLLTSNLPDSYPVCAYDAGGREGGVAKRVVTRAEVSDGLKAVATRLGENMRGLASHSLRIGGATAMAAAGIPDSFICYWGFWASAAYRGYVRHVLEEPWEKELTELLVSQDLHSTKENRASPWGDKAGGEAWLA
jgi:hypothetical protein